MNYADILYSYYERFRFETILFTLLISLLAVVGIIYSFVLYKKREAQALTANNNHNKKRKHRQPIKKYDRTKERAWCITKCSLISVGLAVFLVVVFLQHPVITENMTKDIHDNSFITYEGEFRVRLEPHVGFLSKRPNRVVFSENYLQIALDKRYYDCIFRDSASSQYKNYKNDITFGTYYGILIYGKNSKTIVDWDVEPLP